MPRQSTASTEALIPAPEALPRAEAYDYQFLNPYDAESRTYPYDGKMAIVSDNDKNPGVAAIWRVSRRLQGWRWKSYGEWVTPLTNIKIGFDPMYWRKFTGYSE